MKTTRATISIKDGISIKTIYCHYDGYLKRGVGETLLNHYGEKKKVKDLIELGSLLCLGEHLAPTSDTSYYSRRNSRKQSKKTNKRHSLNSRHKGVTLATFRDGENSEALLMITEMESNKLDSCFSEEFNYLYDLQKERWMIKHTCWVVLTEEMIKNSNK